MLAYVKFSALKPPGNKKIVPISEIKRFYPAQWNTKKQYKVKNGDVYSDAIVLLLDGKFSILPNSTYIPYSPSDYFVGI